MRQKQVGGKYQLTDRSGRVTCNRNGKFALPVNYKTHRKT